MTTPLDTSTQTWSELFSGYASSARDTAITAKDTVWNTLEPVVTTLTNTAANVSLGYLAAASSYETALHVYSKYCLKDKTLYTTDGSGNTLSFALPDVKKTAAKAAGAFVIGGSLALYFRSEWNKFDALGIAAGVGIQSYLAYRSFPKTTNVSFKGE